jgi:molecular chaperone DnaK (HSP70)
MRLGLGQTQIAAPQAADFDAARKKSPSPSVHDLDELSVASLLPEEDDGEADLSGADLDLGAGEADLGGGDTQSIGSSLSNTATSGTAGAQRRRPSVSPLGATTMGQGSPLAGTSPFASPSDQEVSENSVLSALSRPAPPPEQAGVAVPPMGGGPLLLDVTPLSLGVEVTGGYVDRLIERNSPIPCEMTRTFATAQDNQAMVRVRVSQGEEERFNRNTLLGEVELTGISQGPRGSVRIDVSFSLDESGMLQVSARDQSTGNAANARLQLVGVAPGAE